MGAIPMDAKIWVAGATGMVGSAIVRRLVDLGYTNLLGSYHSRRPVAAPDLNWVQTDLSNPSAVNDFFSSHQPDAVFMAAARVGGIHANQTQPAEFIFDNLTIQGNVIDAAYRSGVKRLLFLGSSCIYPRLAPQPMKEACLLTGLLEPTNEPYAIAKIAGIKLCEAYNRQYGTRFFAVMPTNLYGPHDNFDLNRSHVLPAMIRKYHLARLAEQNDWDGIQRDEDRFGTLPDAIKTSLKSDRSEPVVLWGSGLPRREFLHVDDMADACVFIMNLDQHTLAETLLNYPEPCFVNLGAGVDCSIGELAEIVRETVGFAGPTEFDASRPDGAPRKLLDVSRLHRLGWRHRIDLKDGLRSTYDWYIHECA